MSVRGLPARIVEVIEDREPLHQRVRVGRDGAEGGVVAEDGQGGLPVRAGYVPEDLIVGTVFTNDDEDVLDL